MLVSDLTVLDLTVIWLFGQFRWSSYLHSFFSQHLSENHLLGALLEPSSLLVPLRRIEGPCLLTLQQ
jgi:hypothetical protein